MVDAATQPTLAGPTLELPSEWDQNALAAAIRAHANTGMLQEPIILTRPGQNIVLAAYSALLSLTSRYEAERQEREAHEADAESQINETNRARIEAEERYSEVSRNLEGAVSERNSARSELEQSQTELAAVKANLESATAASSEVKAILEKEQREKREILEVLDRERAESLLKTEQIETLKQQTKEQRQENARLSSELQQLRSSENAAKFKIQTLKQELELARKDAEWSHTELSKFDEEHKRFRATKHAEGLRLQSELNDVSQNLTSLQSKTQALQTSFDENSRRLSQAVQEREELHSRLALQEESFRREMETKDRLTSLLERRSEDAKRRVQQVEVAWENVLQEYREREDELKTEISRSLAQNEKLAQEKDDLQIALDRLAESIGIDTTAPMSTKVGTGNGPVTPQAKTFATSLGLGRSGGIAISPTAAITSAMQRSGKTFTEVYTSLAKTEEELRRERLETARLASVLDTVMADLQERAPALQAQREETERLAIALEELSVDFARACEERDQSERGHKDSIAHSSAVSRENQLLTQQLTDLGRQVRHLTRELIIRDDPAAAARLDDEGDAFPSLTDRADLGSDTQDIITTQLVTFDSLTTLVAQNGRLLRVARELGARMEEEEAKWKDRNDHAENEALQEAAQALERLEAEVNSERARTEALRHERDMFRSMLAGGARGIAVPPVVSMGEGNTTHAGLANQYSALQSQFDSFSEETARDAAALKEEARRARDEAGKSAVAAAREKASREATEERLRLLQQAADLQHIEVNELSKRLRTQQDQTARLEASHHTWSEDLFSARKELDRLRYETANLRAERELGKSTEQRLAAENQAMIREKAGLNELLRNVQTMQNEIDRNASETKRRLERQLEKLEEQLRQTQERLEKEETARREAELRRNVESSSLQTRMDRTNQDLAAAREQLAVAQTSMDHFTRKTEDLQKQVNAKEEKLAFYERRNGASVSASAFSSASQELGSEQQLRIELAELRAELRGSQLETEQSKSHVEQFKSIAQASEEALNQLQSTYEAYKAEMESSVLQKNTEISQLRERLESVTAEITALQNEASSARQALEAQRTEFAAERRGLEDAIAELGSVEERAKSEQQGILADVEQHARLAREAQAKYEAELVAHADDIRALSAVKEDLEKSRAEAREAQKSAETALANLASSTTSWNNQKEALVKERDAIQQRLADVGVQNKILHEHLETLTQQVSHIRHSTGNNSLTEGADGNASFSVAPADELQDVVRYLRQEKEIADLQVDLNRQEATRLRLNLEHTTRALEEAKLQIAEERERQSTAAGPGAKQHDELLEKINQLSILRESNATLRDENERANRKASLLQTQLTAVKAEIDPLKESLRSVRSELEVARDQMRIVQEDNQRWQARAQSILSQYDRVDPEKIKKLEQRATTAEGRVAELQPQVDSVRGELANSKEQFAKLRSQATERIQNLRAEVTKLTAQIETLTKEKEQLSASLSVAKTESVSESNAVIEELNQKLTQAEEEKAASQQALSATETRIQHLESQIAQLKSRISDSTPAAVGQSEVCDVARNAAAAQALEEAQKTWQEEKAALEASKTQLEVREKQHHQKAREFLQGMRQAQKERDELKKERDEAVANIKKEIEDGQAPADPQFFDEKSGPQQSSTSQGGVATAERSATLTTEAETLKTRIDELETALKAANIRIAELEALLAEAADTNSDGANADIEKLKAQHAEELRNQQASLSQQYQKRQTMAVEVAVKKTQAAASGMTATADPKRIEQQVQERLKAFEIDRDRAQAAAIQAAVEAKEKELREALAAPADAPGVSNDKDEEQMKARYEAGYTAGKNEASLRNQLLIKQKDSKIAKLTTELAELKGEAMQASTPVGASPDRPNESGGTAAGRGDSQGAIRGGRGGAAVAGVAGALPVRPAIAGGAHQAGPQPQQAGGTQTMVRGRAFPRGANIRGVGGRGGAPARRARGSAQMGGAGGAQKRKASEDTTVSGTASGSAGTSGQQGAAAAGGASPTGGGLAKKAKGE